MPEFRLTQISDPHLARRQPKLTDNFHRVSEYIDATRPDLVVNSGDLAFDGPAQPDSNSPKRCMMRFPSPAATCPAIMTSATTRPRLVRYPLNPSPSKVCRRSVRSSVKTAGVSMPPAGVSSASTQW